MTCLSKMIELIGVYIKVYGKYDSLVSILPQGHIFFP